jgi:hypothetical protein
LSLFDNFIGTYFMGTLKSILVINIIYIKNIIFKRGVILNG